MGRLYKEEIFPTYKPSRSIKCHLKQKFDTIFAFQIDKNENVS